MENVGLSSECSSKNPTKPQTSIAGTSYTPDTHRSASPSLEHLREASTLSQIRKSVQSRKYAVHNFQKGPFFSQRDSFDLGEETDSDDGELDSENDEDIPGLRDMGRTHVEGTKGAYRKLYLLSCRC
jgi:hypothetical protein